MKAVTEFASFTLAQGLKIKADLAAEGKSPEDVQTGLGEKFKYEGDKLKYFTHALEVAAQNSSNLRRVMVMSLAEGENAPAKATQLEEHYYVPEFHVEARKVEAPAKDARGGRGGGKGGGKGGNKDKESPWGLSPEQKAAKKGAGAAGKAAKPN